MIRLTYFIKNFYFLIICIVAGLIVGFFECIFHTDFLNPFSHKNENFILKELFWATILLSSVDFFILKKKIFKHTTNPFRLFINLYIISVIVLSIYKWKMAVGLSIALILLCFLYGLIHRNFFKPTLPQIGMFSYYILGFLGIFWANNSITFKQIFDQINHYPILISIPIVGCLYKVSKSERNSISLIIFKLYKNILTLNLLLYTFLSTHYQKFFSFLSLDKNYLSPTSYYRLLQWSESFHPSRISWLFLVVGGLGFYLQKNKFISKIELIYYQLALLSFSLMVQARSIMIGVFIVILFFLYQNTMLKNINFGKKLTINIIIFCISVIAIYKLSHLEYFFDEHRLAMHTQSFKDFWLHPIWGGGTGHQLEVIQQLGLPFNKLHNDVLTTIVNWGVIGCAILLFWITSVFYYAHKKRYLMGIYIIVVFSVFALTDGILNHAICCPFFLLYLLRK